MRYIKEGGGKMSMSILKRGRKMSGGTKAYCVGVVKDLRE